MDHAILGQTALAYSPVIDRNRSVAATRLTVWPLQQSAQLDASLLLQALAELAKRVLFLIGKGVDSIAEEGSQDTPIAVPTEALSATTTSGVSR